MGVLHPSFNSFLTMEYGKCRGARRDLRGLPVEQRSGQAFGQRFPRIKTEDPFGSEISKEVTSGIVVSLHQLGSVLPCHSGRRIVRAVVNDEDFVAGIEGLQRSSKPERVIVGMEDCGERGHDSV